MLQTNNTGVCSQCLSHTGSTPPFMARVASLPTLLRLQVAPPGTIRGQPWLNTEIADILLLTYTNGYFIWFNLLLLDSFIFHFVHFLLRIPHIFLQRVTLYTEKWSCRAVKNSNFRTGLPTWKSLPYTSYMTLDKLLILSMSVFPHP